MAPTSNHWQKQALKILPMQPKLLLPTHKHPLHDGGRKSSTGAFSELRIRQNRSCCLMLNPGLYYLKLQPAFAAIWLGTPWGCMGKKLIPFLSRTVPYVATPGENGVISHRNISNELDVFHLLINSKFCINIKSLFGMMIIRL